MADQPPTLLVMPTPQPPASLDDPIWESTASEARIAHYHDKSSDHRPAASCRVLYDSQALYLRFDVEDRYVVARHAEPNSPVYQDSCAEFFFSPADGIYINVETNCLGASLVQLHTYDAPREGKALAPALVARLDRTASLAGRLAAGADELAEPTRWRLGLTVPLDVVAEAVGGARLELMAAEASESLQHGPLRMPAPGVEWGGNFFKCADGSTHPHWGAWAPIGEPLNFHKPECFGRLVFA